VCEDAEIDHAVNGVIFGIFSSAGQSCIAGARLFVAAKIHDPFMERLVAKTKALRIGDPESEKTQMGPQITPEHRASIEAFIEAGRKDGGIVLCGGERPSGAVYAKGNYLLPTIVDGLKNSARIAQEEIFGPVLSIIPYDDEDDAVRIANDTIYGLAGGVWSGDAERAKRVARRLRTGQVEINGGKFNPMAPFGGYKQSGHGRELGKYGLEEYLEVKAMLT